MTNTSNTQVQNDVSQTSRHGYAVYADEIMFAWTMVLKDAITLPRATRIVNVQNGAYFDVRNGVVLHRVTAA